MIVEVCYDSDGVYIPIPEELLNSLGWQEGDYIRWERDLVGVVLSKVEYNEEEDYYENEI